MIGFITIKLAVLAIPRGLNTNISQRLLIAEAKRLILITTFINKKSNRFLKLVPMNMTITVPASYSGLTVTPPFHVRFRRQFTPFATLSTPPNTSSSSRQAAVDWVEETASFFELDNRPIMLFDGVCNLCNGGVKFVRDNDSRRTIRYEALQSEAGKNLLRRSGRAPDDISSVVLVEKDRAYVKSEAVLKIMEYINLPFPQLAFFLQFVPLFIRDFAYDNVANNRYALFGRSDSCEI